MGNHDVEKALAAAEAQRPKPVLQLTLTLWSNGEVSVNGPLQEKAICLGMMERAKLVIDRFQPQEAIAAAQRSRLIHPG